VTINVPTRPDPGHTETFSLIPRGRHRLTYTQRAIRAIRRTATEILYGIPAGFRILAREWRILAMAALIGLWAGLFYAFIEAVNS
jgi:hypothetical protein